MPNHDSFNESEEGESDDQENSSNDFDQVVPNRLIVLYETSKQFQVMLFIF